MVGEGGDAVVAELRAMRSRLALIVADAAVVTDAVRVERLAVLEQLKGAAGGAQVAETVRFARSQVEAQREADVDPRALGRGIADQIGMATKVGPWHGSRRLEMARALWFDLPAAYELLVAGEISEYVGQQIVTETSHLDPETRRLVDKHLVAAGLASLTPKQAANLARREAYRAHPQAAASRAGKARKDRRVSLRPAPDTMSLLSGLLPVEQGVACYAALRREADARRAAGDERTKGQIMADTLVERVTGQAQADDVPVEVAIVMPLDALLDPDSREPADVSGFGPIPAGVLADLLGASTAKQLWRRIFTAPSGGGQTVVGCDPRARRFSGVLGKVLRLRDQHCREPYCDAPIRHGDHLVPYRDGGATVLANGRGVCERHNYVREMPGWRVTPLDPDDPGGPHTVTTPTGHPYFSRAPDPP